MIKRRVFFCVCFFMAFLCIQIEQLGAMPGSMLRYTVIPENPRPGEPVTIAVANAFRHAVLTRGERRFARSAFFTILATDERPGFMVAVLTIPSTVNPGPAVIRLESDWNIVHEIPITIASREFHSETIHLNPVLTEIRTDASPRRATEVDRLWSILGTTGNVIYHTGKFVPPVTSTRRTSSFGSRRVFQHSDGRSDTSIHAGVDYGVPTGTQVVASGAGRVVLAAMRISTGYSVIIEHAPGIYSLYYHLDKIEVEEGTIVEAGAQIGLSGATGLATGPHLHWEVRVSSENTDPDAFLARPIVDKNLIISRIYNIELP